MSFDRSRLKIRPLSERVHDLSLSAVLPLKAVDQVPPAVARVARRVATARRSGAPVILIMGGHVIRSGTQRYLLDLLERGVLAAVAMNGSGAIHDWELALVGGTTESVARYIRTGEFGLWKETGSLNDAVNAAYRRGGLGLGEALGEAILDGPFPHKDVSLLAGCRRLGVPATVHVGIGCDITHEHPNFDGAATGHLSYADFLTFAGLVEGLEGGVFLNLGTAVTGPEVFLKALAMARNVAAQEGRRISRFTTAVFDLLDLPESPSAEPPREDPAYYFRPYKTLLVRTVAEGGESVYVRGRHAETIPALWTALTPEGRRPGP